jgi:hypothetical protein
MLSAATCSLQVADIIIIIIITITIIIIGEYFTPAW